MKKRNKKIYAEKSAPTDIKLEKLKAGSIVGRAMTIHYEGKGGQYYKHDFGSKVLIIAPKGAKKNGGHYLILFDNGNKLHFEKQRGIIG